MDNCVREFTPVEMVRSDLFNFFENKNLILNEEMKISIYEIFCKGISYEDECAKKRAYLQSNSLNTLTEENKILKTQLRVLTKYIEEHEM